MKNVIDKFIDEVTSQYKEEEPENKVLEEEEIDDLLVDDDDYFEEEEEEEDYDIEEENEDNYVSGEEDVSIEVSDTIDNESEVDTDKVYDLIKEVIDTINMSISDIIEINSDRVKVVVERLLEYIVAQSLTMRILDDFKQKFEKDEKVKLIINDKYLQDTFVLIDKINILKILLDIYFEESDIKDYLYRKIVDSFIENKR